MGGDATGEAEPQEVDKEKTGAGAWASPPNFPGRKAAYAAASVFIIDDEGDEVLSRKWNIMYVGYDIPEVAQKLFPWANISIDEDFYEEHAVEDDSEDYIRMSLQRATDEDNGIFHEDLSGSIYPYDNYCGEVEAYRLELKLNDLGRSFLVLSKHLNEEE